MKKNKIIKSKSSIKKKAVVKKIKISRKKVITSVAASKTVYSKTKKVTSIKKNKVKQNIVLFVGPAPTILLSWIRDRKKKYRFYNLQSRNAPKKDIKAAEDVFDEVITCTFSNDDSIVEALASFHDQIVAMLSRSEAKMWYFKRTIPHVPYILTPTEKSLIWATDKIEMRKRMYAYNPLITPKFALVKDAEDDTIDTIEKKIGYPLMVKPSGLSSSMLVTNCYHRDELEKALKAVFKQATIFHKLYKEFYKDDTPQVLVEDLMEGEMYSVDGVVDAKGKCTFYPSVHIKTGKQIGFDDYFGYQQITPTLLNQENYDDMITATRTGVYSLGLRNTHFHAELIRSEEGWKIIEIAPRMGGFRQQLYKMSYSIDCTANDIRVRVGHKPKVRKTVKGYTAALKVFAKKEGTIRSMKGVKKINDIKSIFSIFQSKKVGDKVKFAKNGGKAVFIIMLHNKDRSELLADIRRVEQELDIVVE